MKLIKYYGFDKLLDRLSPTVVYRGMMERAFLDNDQGQHAESLRNCINSLNFGGHRMTPEFDSLIEVDD